jgi:hypothetical protein
MSALGHQLPQRGQVGMSALPPIADIASRFYEYTPSRACTHKFPMSAVPPIATKERTWIDVGFVPQVDITRSPRWQATATNWER